MAGRSYPIPSRTRSSSSPAPMVLHRQLCGRVGRRRGLYPQDPREFSTTHGGFAFLPRHFGARALAAALGPWRGTPSALRSLPTRRSLRLPGALLLRAPRPNRLPGATRRRSPRAFGLPAAPFSPSSRPFSLSGGSDDPSTRAISLSGAFCGLPSGPFSLSGAQFLLRTG